MALNNYRRVDIILDTANDKVDWQSPLNANTGEYNSRNLRVQLTNGGIVEPQTANLYFGFRHVETGESGVVPMNKVDSSRGIYEVYYPREMMAKEGVVICAVKIVDTVDGTNHINLTANFTVNVERSTIDDSMEVPENSLRVFDKLIIDVMVHERRVSVIEDTLKEVLREYKDLRTWLSNNTVTKDQIADLALSSQKIVREHSFGSIFKNLYYETNIYANDDIGPSNTSFLVFRVEGSGTLLNLLVHRYAYPSDNDTNDKLIDADVIFSIRTDGVEVCKKTEKYRSCKLLNYKSYKDCTRYSSIFYNSLFLKGSGDFPKTGYTAPYLTRYWTRGLEDYQLPTSFKNNVSNKSNAPFLDMTSGTGKAISGEKETYGISFNSKLEMIFKVENSTDIKRYWRAYIDEIALLINPKK